MIVIKKYDPVILAKYAVEKGLIYKTVGSGGKDKSEMQKYPTEHISIFWWTN